MSGLPPLVARYAAAVQTGRDIARQVGARYDENPAWRANETRIEQLWAEAQAAGHTRAELMRATVRTEDA
ncbi:hypothetical protein [Streptomyces sp. NPDC127038]|uniref:hypothetical protein n=1 Tax=Streptomyces sp. NPDC127038 TaxID=3347114 RepID=UPI0036557E71